MDKTRVKLFPNFTCHHLITHTNYFFILYILPHKEILQKETEKITKIANLLSRKSYNNISATLPAILRDLTFVTDKVASGLAQ